MSKKFDFYDGKNPSDDWVGDEYPANYSAQNRRVNRNPAQGSANRNISSHSAGNGKKKNPLKSLNIKRVVSMILCVLFLIFGSALTYYNSVLDSLNFHEFNDPDTTNPSGSGDPSDPSGDSSLTFSESDLLNDSMVLNVMLFGDDSRDEALNQFGRSDTMILLSIDNRHQKIKLTSFQRDTYVNIPGYGYNKLNASYSYGGPQLTIKTLEANFGINIDRYAVVGFSSFTNIINTLGGVDIELTDDEIAYINHQARYNTEIAQIESGAGMVHLNGTQALWYARDRGWDYEGDDFKVSGDDWDRTSRQRNLLQVLMKDMRSANIGQIISIVSQVGPMITTNLKKDEITFLATNALKYLKYDMEEVSVPFEGIWRYSWTEDGQSIIEITDWTECRKQLVSFVFGTDESASAPSSSEQ